MYRLIIFIALLLTVTLASAQDWDFTLHKHQSGQPGPTMLVIGGIQGDEPGGFNAASLLATDYSIQSGEVWVVPNLNFESIIKRSRGVHGDMNRKFKDIQDKDPEYQLVQKIKSIIRDERVDIILNLHDGSGFYRTDYIDHLHNPRRWGQSLIIDQAELTGVAYGNLGEIAEGIIHSTNARIKDQDHSYRIKNTETRKGDREMEKTLTYYAIRHGKSAFGIEASKSFGTHYRAYYHLEMIESFMRYLGIKYQRKFELSINSVKQRIDNNIQVALYEKKLFFDFRNVRERLRYIPMKKDAPIAFSASNSLIAVLDHDRYYNIRYGNRSVTKLIPQYFDFDNSLESINLIIDGVETEVELGNIISVNKHFQVNAGKNYRVNVIGFTRPGLWSEQGVLINRADIARRFSVDQQGLLFRVEIYRDKHFCGMVLVDFSRHPVAVISPLKTDKPL